VEPDVAHLHNKAWLSGQFAISHTPKSYARAIKILTLAVGIEFNKFPAVQYCAVMSGTLALWYESKTASNIDAPIDPKDPANPHLRLHINLWRDIDKNFNFLDIGLLLTHVDFIGRIYLYLPASIEKSSIFDLSNALKDGETLNAVFNEVSILQREEDNYFFIKTKSDTPRIIHQFHTENDVAVNSVNVPGSPQGTIIALKNSICERISDPKNCRSEHYIRLRIFLKGEARNLFTTEDRAASVGLSLTQDILETTEFRLNERRSYPADILQRAAQGSFVLDSIHYFLIRDRGYQLSSQHQTFRKVRHLEYDIWTTYLEVGQPAKHKRLKSQSTGGMAIYQWREIASIGKEIDDFIAYASFRTVRPRIAAYLVAILAIGGVGSAVLNCTLSLIETFSTSYGIGQPTPGFANFYSLGSIVAVKGSDYAIKPPSRGVRCPL
jgi:hypothetical protein